MSEKEVLIEGDVEEWLSEHDKVHIESLGEREILTANKHGDLHVGRENNPMTVNISDDGVTLL